jgi:hypothetical protein
LRAGWRFERIQLLAGGSDNDRLVHDDERTDQTAVTSETPYDRMSLNDLAFNVPDSGQNPDVELIAGTTSAMKVHMTVTNTLPPAINA